MVTPARPGSRKGNGVTTKRWASILRQLGCKIHIFEEFNGEPCDIMIALHARRSFHSIENFRQSRPTAPLIVALTGTDVYQDIHHSEQAKKSLEWADQMIVLQPLAIEELPEHLRPKTKVVYQSVVPPKRLPGKSKGNFDVAVVANLRDVKDPFQAEMASRMLPPSSRIRVIHAGSVLQTDMKDAALEKTKTNVRYQWIGSCPFWKSKQLIARSQVLVLSSLMEGGANVTSEAIVLGTPIIASRVSGNIGMLGEDYPGYFNVGDTKALSELLVRSESDMSFLKELQKRIKSLAPQYTPEKERKAWQEILQSFSNNESG